MQSAPGDSSGGQEPPVQPVWEQCLLTASGILGQMRAETLYQEIQCAGDAVGLPRGPSLQGIVQPGPLALARFMVCPFSRGNMHAALRATAGRSIFHGYTAPPNCTSCMSEPQHAHHGPSKLLGTDVQLPGRFRTLHRLFGLLWVGQMQNVDLEVTRRAWPQGFRLLYVGPKSRVWACELENSTRTVALKTYLQPELNLSEQEKVHLATHTPVS